MPEALYFTDDAEANALIARNPLALLIGFALDQQVTVPQAFTGPRKLEQRLGGSAFGLVAPAVGDGPDLFDAEGRRHVASDRVCVD